MQKNFTGDKKVPHGVEYTSEYSANALVTEANQKFYFVHCSMGEEPEETILKQVTVSILHLALLLKIFLEFTSS